ncbi:hypothetical protein BDR05DRAFT_946972 [Suillus weaverae]|nr:hypothetical protein BDR05DRAFT_946972 [Suillus weaverae]
MLDQVATFGGLLIKKENIKKGLLDSFEPSVNPETVETPSSMSGKLTPYFSHSLPKLQDQCVTQLRSSYQYCGPWTTGHILSLGVRCQVQQLVPSAELRIYLDTILNIESARYFVLNIESQTPESRISGFGDQRPRAQY